MHIQCHIGQPSCICNYKSPHSYYTYCQGPTQSVAAVCRSTTTLSRLQGRSHSLHNMHTTHINNSHHRTYALQIHIRTLRTHRYIHTLLHHTLLHIYPLQHPIHISTPRIRAHPMPHTRPSMHLQLQIPTFILHLPLRSNLVSCCSLPIHDNSFAPSGPKSLSKQRAHNTH